MKLRLLLTDKCNRSCPGCCNNDWDLSSLPSIEGIFFDQYDEIMLTGGEPMLDPPLIISITQEIRKVTREAKIWLYTAKSKRPLDLVAMLNWVDGITLTLHEQYDVKGFVELNKYIRELGLGKSFRLNVFKGITLPGINPWPWLVQNNIEWIVDCPLPTNEVFMQL